MHCSLLLAVGWSVFVLAAPHASIVPRDDTTIWTPPVANYFITVYRKIERARKGYAAAACNFASAVMPTTAPTPLPTPDDGVALYHIAIGRGVQNYSCAANASSTAAPVSVGAVAMLYNASCTACVTPDLLSLLPNMALQFPPTGPDAQLIPSNLEPSGHHYFAADGTPVFDLQTSKNNYGIFMGKRNASAPAPSDAPKGPGGKGDGSVAWLKLVAKPDSRIVKNVFRVNTAGGNAPATCAGMPETFSVPYASE
ncbi:MAG: hypothetical protein M1829_005332 [Trizodia sp. TS-e1964]|nr:MAG: hypothetical protein M1829_005332 [Trizodia sp. TS-e1964]